MRVRILNQPVADRDEWLGYSLRSLLESRGENGFSEFRLLVAFVKTSGLVRISNAIESFKQSGGHISAIVGIDSRGTSKQALRMLKALADEVYVYHDTSLNRTFHPKLYMLLNPGSNATVLVGSSNFTAGGLFTNHEIMTQIELKLDNEEDIKLFEEIDEIFNFYKDDSTGCSVRLSEDLIKTLEEETNLLSDEDEDRDRLADPKEAAAGTDQPEFGTLFGTQKFPPAPQPNVSRPTQTVPAKSIAPSGFWKVLSNFDVNPFSAPGQIIIPIKFVSYFPQVTMTKGPDAGGKGRQWECSLNVLFIDSGANIMADDARFIIYQPKTGHPRPNTESRFTFHSKNIFNKLSAGDMLIFQQTFSQYWFQVILAHPGSQQYQTYRGQTNLRFGEI